MGVEPISERDVLFNTGHLLEEHHDWYPDVQHVVDVEFVPMAGELYFNADNFVMYMSDDHESHPETVGPLLESALSHVNWHPNQVWRDPHIDMSFHMPDDDTVEDQPGEPADTVHRLYNEAVDQYFKATSYAFDPPRIVVDTPVYEEDGTFQNEVEELPVGYVIEPETNQFVVDANAVNGLNPTVLRKEFRDMLDAYFSVSLDHGLRRDIDSYVQSLNPDGDLSWEMAAFDSLDEGSAQYCHGTGIITFEENLKAVFDPNRGRFTREFPEYARLHEVVHDKDFNNNPATVDYSRNSLDLPDLKTTEDARNAVFELPTTFETYMAGYRRDDVMDVFHDPKENMYDFFDGYTGLNTPNRFLIEFEAEDRISYKKGDTVRDPYNFAQFTAIALHRSNVAKYGEEDAADRTREQLYTNDWNIIDVKHVMEDSLAVLDMPNFPRRKRQMHERYRDHDDIDAFATTEARSIIHQFDQADMEHEQLEHVLAAKELLGLYEDERSFRNAPPELEYLDDLVCRELYDHV